MIPINSFRDVCQKLDSTEFAAKYPEPVLVQLALGSHMVVASSPRETMYRARGLGKAPKSARLKGSAYLVYRVKRKPKAKGNRISLGFLRTNDVVVQEATVSRVHAYFEKGANGHAVVDAGSSHGMTVNDKKVALGKLTPLRSGDRLTIGSVSTLFFLPEDFHKFVRRVIGS